MKNLALRIFGIALAVLFGDPAAFDRWWWLRHRLRRGDLRTLDAGCGSGALTLYAARAGNDAIGISFDDRNNRVATERTRLLGITRVKFMTGDLRKLNTFASSLGIFDQIICFETIEHIKDDRKLLHDLASVLHPDGKLFLTAPYERCRLPGDGISDVENGGHVRWGYTHESISALMRDVGLQLVEFDYVTGIISQMLIRWYRLLSRVVDFRIAWALIFPFRILAIFDPLVTKFMRHPYLSVAVVAEKPAQ